jgi:hypothetical protein
MALLLITYDSHKSEQSNPYLLAEINSYSNIRLSDNSYAIITDKHPSRVCGELKQFIDAKDKIFVINLKSPFDGYGSEQATDWLRKTLIP